MASVPLESGEEAVRGAASWWTCTGGGTRPTRASTPIIRLQHDAAAPRDAHQRTGSAQAAHTLQHHHTAIQSATQPHPATRPTHACSLLPEDWSRPSFFALRWPLTCPQPVKNARGRTKHTRADQHRHGARRDAAQRLSGLKLLNGPPALRLPAQRADDRPTD